MGYPRNVLNPRKFHIGKTPQTVYDWKKGKFWFAFPRNFRPENICRKQMTGHDQSILYCHSWLFRSGILCKLLFIWPLEPVCELISEYYKLLTGLWISIIVKICVRCSSSCWFSWGSDGWIGHLVRECLGDIVWWQTWAMSPRVMINRLRSKRQTQLCKHHRIGHGSLKISLFVNLSFSM